MIPPNTRGAVLSEPNCWWRSNRLMLIFEVLGNQQNLGVEVDGSIFLQSDQLLQPLPLPALPA